MQMIYLTMHAPLMTIGKGVTAPFASFGSTEQVKEQVKIGGVGNTENPLSALISTLSTQHKGKRCGLSIIYKVGNEYLLSTCPRRFHPFYST
jgi:hypothetical protein